MRFLLTLSLISELDVLSLVSNSVADETDQVKPLLAAYHTWEGWFEYWLLCFQPSFLLVLLGRQQPCVCVQPRPGCCSHLNSRQQRNDLSFSNFPVLLCLSNILSKQILKIKSKCVKNLSIRSKAVKLLEKKQDDNLNHFFLGKEFLR